MAEYQVTVYTQDMAYAGTKDDVYITLVGKRGSSQHGKLGRNKFFFHRGDSTFTVTCSADLGELLLIHLEKRGLVIKDSWLPAKVEVRSSNGKLYVFPIYHWLKGNKKHFFREGAGLFLSHVLCCPHAVLQNDLTCFWGIPLCMKADTLMSLPLDDRYPFTRDLDKRHFAQDYKKIIFLITIAILLLLLLSKIPMLKSETQLQTFLSKRIFFVIQRKNYVMKHWREDAFFGYQFLNGVNPMMIRRCKTLPSKFPVPSNMIFGKSWLTLRTEMMKGNIYLSDYNILDGVETNTINGRKQFLAAPLVLFHKNEYNEMMPIAIQLKQKPGRDNPIFFPTDSEYDWLLAKTYVKSADFNLHELNFHLLRTHLLAEVFAVSLQRNLPRVHPVFKLLIRHTRYTLQINFLARNLLISKIGILTLVTSGGKGILTLLDRSVSSMTYRSLCIPDDIADRGLEDVPNFYYRDDGLKLWNIMFVHDILSFYYKYDWMVQNDAELQNWIQEIFENGFLRRIPQKFITVAELVKFVTMVMFTCSAQHTAVNDGQYDFYGWMPNGPSTMKKPPPTQKGKADEASFLSTLPDVETTVLIMATVWLSNMQTSDRRYLHQFVEEHFTEDFPRYKVTVFQRELKKLSKEIYKRNRDLELPYTYLDPKLVENSVAI
uniref:Lipoxygenase domain-containing protein n=1 Tax=Oryzias latipes TaxID=8090 RepID=A0A3B3HQX4_ORYLA